MPYCRVNGIRIYYEVAGEGRPFALIHANPFDHRLWLYQIAHFSSFFRVIAVDLRGYGYSDKPTTPTSLSMMAEDVVRVCRQEGVKEAVVAGISVGGGIALQLGLDHPDIFKALVLVGCSAGPSRHQERIEGYLRQGVKGYHIQHLRSLMAPEFPETPLGRYLLGLFTDSDPKLNPEALARIFEALEVKDLGARLSELNMPVLVINGEHDGALPRSREMSEKIRGAVHHVIAGAGHACCIEKPADFDRIVIDFLKKNNLVTG